LTWLGTRKSSESVKHPVEYFSKGFPDFFSRLRSMCGGGAQKRQLVNSQHVYELYNNATSINLKLL